MQDIYQVQFPGSQLDYMLVRGVVTDVSEEPVGARITVMDAARSEILGVYNANKRTGRYVLVLDPGEQYALTVEATGHSTQDLTLVAASSDSGDREMSFDLVMTPSVVADRTPNHE